MKRKILTAGVAALALLFVIGLLAGCASTDERRLKKAGVPMEERAFLYLIYQEHRLERIDGQRNGFFLSFDGLLQGWPGILGKDGKPSYPKEVSLTEGQHVITTESLGAWPVHVTAGEHTIIISAPAFVGRKKYTGTFNFEAGKKYLIQLVTPSEYARMMRGGTWADLAADAANVLKEGLAGNYIIIIAETTKAQPTWYDSTIPNNSWVRGSEAEAAANEAASGE